MKVYDGATLIATVVADSSGFSSAPVTLGAGIHSLTATQTVGSQTSDASAPVSVTTNFPVRAQQGGKLTGGGAGGEAAFGADVALSADGNTALVGGPYDNGDAGAAWVFTRSGSTWTQEGLKLTGGGAVNPAQFGWSVALSADGNTALVGGRLDNDGVGAAWVFTRSGSTWTQQGSKLTGAGASGFGLFGLDVALSADGNTAVIGGPEDNNGVGAMWVFTRSGSTWTQQGAKLTGSGMNGPAGFGASVAVSSNGNTALAGGRSTTPAPMSARSGRSRGRARPGRSRARS